MLNVARVGYVVSVSAGHDMTDSIVKSGLLPSIISTVLAIYWLQEVARSSFGDGSWVRPFAITGLSLALMILIVCVVLAGRQLAKLERQKRSG